MIWKLPTRTLRFPRRPLVMGIVNINADSFSGDGTLDPVEALAHAGRLVADGADVIDVGGESARTNRVAIAEAEEMARVLPFIEGWHRTLADEGWHPADETQVWPPVLSINTWRPAVADATLAAGGELLNDMSALPDDTNARIAARHNASLLIMHSIGEPKVPHTHVQYRDVLAELDTFFASRITLAIGAGLTAEQLILDPGIDFAKQRDDNLRLFRGLNRLHHFQRPLLMPVSRKTVIGEVLGLPNAIDRDAGTMACIVAGLEAGAHLYRVHHVRAAWQAIRLWHDLFPTTLP